MFGSNSPLSKDPSPFNNDPIMITDIKLGLVDAKEDESISHSPLHLPCKARTIPTDPEEAECT